jgi:GT2 family glycosyltransferase
MNLAPIVLFVYNRPVHTKKTLEALQRNHLASESVLYIYADGGKENVTVVQLKNIEETRRIIKEQQWCGEVHIIESSHNRGLAASIIHGVTEVVGQYGNVIVLEDDIVTSTGFLNYMNDALNFYEDISEVMHISGYMYPQNSNLPETFFYNVTLCWGWATWKSAWKYYINDAVFLWKEISRRNLFLELNKFGGDYLSAQLAQNISGKLDTWFIKWHASVLLKNGFTLFPRISLVDNIGFDSSGVHNGSFNEFEIPKLIDKIQVCEINLDENKTAAIIFKNFYAQLGIKKIKKHKFYLKVYIKKTARKILLKLLPEIRKNYFNQNTNVLTNSVTGINVKLYEKAYEVNEEVAIISPVQFQNDNRTLDTRFVYHVTEAGIETSQLFNEPFKEVLFINAAAWLLPMSTLEVIGGFDPLFQHYGEDDNYCHRVLYHHKKIILATQSHFIHDRNNNIPSEPKIYSSIWWKLKERRFKVMYANPLKFEKPILDYYGTVLKKLSMGKINNVLQVLKLRSKQRDWFKACQLSKQITQTKGPHYL